MKTKKVKDKETGKIYIAEIDEEEGIATVIGGGDKSISNAITLPTRTTFTIPQLKEKFDILD